MWVACCVHERSKYSALLLILDPATTLYIRELAVRCAKYEIPLASAIEYSTQRWVCGPSRFCCAPHCRERITRASGATQLHSWCLCPFHDFPVVHKHLTSRCHTQRPAGKFQNLLRNVDERQVCSWGAQDRRSDRKHLLAVGLLGVIWYLVDYDASAPVVEVRATMHETHLAQ